MKGCQRNYSNRLIASHTEDYLEVKSHGNSTYAVAGEERKMTGSQYIDFISWFMQYIKSVKGITGGASSEKNYYGLFLKPYIDRFQVYIFPCAPVTLAPSINFGGKKI